MLNLDALEDYEAALTAVERHFLAYNPGPILRTCRIVFKHLPDADYFVTAGQREEKKSSKELERGLPITLSAREHLRLTLHRSDHRSRQLQLQQQQDAQCLLARCYQILQQRADEQGISSVAPQVTQTFIEACKNSRDGLYTNARTMALQLSREISMKDR